MKEIWKPIKGYEGLYEVSSYGRVRSVDRIVTYSDGRKGLYKGRVLKPSKDSYGYLKIYLSKNSKGKTFKVHRLVAEAFINNPSNLPEVNHKDENKANNSVFLKKDGSLDLNKSNLEWCDSKYNMNYGTARQRIGEKLSRTVLQIDKEKDVIISEYPSTIEAARKLKISNSSISKCCRGEYKTAYGYKWRYKKE